MAKMMGQHKLMAMGDRPNSVPSRTAKFSGGGGVKPMKTGIPTSPITDAKRANGIPGMKKGGRC